MYGSKKEGIMPSFYTGRYKCGSCGYFTNNFYLYDFPQAHPLKNHYWKGPYHACEECGSMHPLVRQAEKLGEAHAWGPHSIHSRADWLDLNFLPTPQEWKEEDEKRVRVRAYLDSLAAPALGEAIDEKKARAPVLRLEASQPSPGTQERTPQPSQTEIPSAVPIVYDTSEEAYKAMRIEDNRRLRATYNPDLPAEFPEEVIEVEALALQRLHAKAEAWI